MNAATRQKILTKLGEARALIVWCRDYTDRQFFFEHDLLDDVRRGIDTVSGKIK